MVHITHTLMQYSPFNPYSTSPLSTHSVDPHVGPLNSDLLQLILDDETGPQTIGQRRPETGKGHHTRWEGVLLWQQGDVGKEDEEVEEAPDAGCQVGIGEEH